eukprot:NODE_13_length_54415_cov_0.522424.p18 type:complete len:337 gc:universal NODE_13_length_54415_cov_0.522424:10018-11028(+)
MTTYVSSREGYRGVYMKKSSKNIMFVPDKDILSPSKIKKWLSCCDLEQLPDMETLTMALICSKDMPLLSYFDELPWEQDMLLYHKLDLPPHFQDLLNLQKQFIKSIYSKLLKSACNSHIQLLKDKTLFLNAFVMMNTRCVAVQNEVLLMKGFDMLNHNTKSTVELDVVDGGIELRSSVEIAKDEQVFLNYGPHDNLFLLVEYGFVLDNNENDLINVTHYLLPLLTKSQKILLKDNHFLGDYCVGHSGFDFRSRVALHVLEHNTFTFEVLESYPNLMIKILDCAIQDYKNMQFGLSYSSYIELQKLKSIHMEILKYWKAYLLNDLPMHLTSNPNSCR